MWNRWRRAPEPVKPPTEFALEASIYTVYISATEVQINHNPNYQLLSIKKEGWNDDTVDRLYKTLCDVYVCDPPQTTPAQRTERIRDVFSATYSCNTEDKDEDRLEIRIRSNPDQIKPYFQDSDKTTFNMQLYFRGPDHRRYPPISLDVGTYSLSLSRKAVTLHGWTLKSATFDIDPIYATETYSDMGSLHHNLYTTDIDIIVAMLYTTRVSKSNASLIDDGQTLRIYLRPDIYEVVLLFTKTLAAASAQRLLEGIARVLDEQPGPHCAYWMNSQYHIVGTG
jgi:hypothetical protein